MKNLSWHSLILLPLLGVALKDETFAKLHVGPLYVLDASALLALLAGGAVLWKNFKQIVLKNPLLPFTVWAFVCFCLSWDPTRLDRGIRHSVLWIYPMLWSTLGWISSYKMTDWERKAVVSPLTIVLGIAGVLQAVSWMVNPRGPEFINLSLGPLLLVPALFYSFTSFNPLLFVPAFLPIWMSWTTLVSRTQLVQLVSLVLVTFFIFLRRSTQFIAKTAMVLSILILGIAGIWVLNLYNPSLFQSDYKPFHAFQNTPQNQMLRGLIHGDDTPLPQEGADASPQFRGRFRADLWDQALRDWAPTPLVGLGFFKEVPSQLAPGIPNDEKISVPHPYRAIAGPHNSYIGILARTGVIGLVLFLVGILLPFLSLLKQEHTFLSQNLTRLWVFSIYFSGLIYAFLNLGFESPHHMVWLWWSYGVLNEQLLPTKSEPFHS